MNKFPNSFEIWGQIPPEPFITVTIGWPSNRKTGSGVLHTLSNLRSAIDRLGMSERDAKLTKIAQETFRQKRNEDENYRFSDGNYIDNEYVTERNSSISAFSNLVQKGEICWEKEKDTDLLSSRFEVPVLASGGQIEYYFDKSVDDASYANHTASLRIRRSDNMIFASTWLKKIPQNGSPRDYYRIPTYKYEERLFIDTTSHYFKLFKSSGIDRTPMSCRILKAHLEHPHQEDSFNIGTMPAPEIFPTERLAKNDTED